MRKLSILSASAVLVALGCSGDNTPSGPTGGSGSATVTVGAGGNNFSPSSINVPAGGTVTWNWNSGGVVHNVTFQDASTSGDMSSGSFQKIFPTAGTFSYLCTIHGPSMSGTVTVSGTSGDGGTTGGGGTGGGGGYP